KHYDKGITCCHSSGPRALALAPTAAYLQTSDTLYVSTFEPSRARFKIGGDSVEIVQQSGFPTEGRSTLVVRTAKPVNFALKVRVPQWAAPLRAGDVVCDGGWASLPAKTWNDGPARPVILPARARYPRRIHELCPRGVRVGTLRPGGRFRPQSPDRVHSRAAPCARYRARAGGLHGWIGFPGQGPRAVGRCPRRRKACPVR